MRVVWSNKNIVPELQDGEIICFINNTNSSYGVTTYGRVWSYKTAKWLKQHAPGQGKYPTVSISYINCRQQHQYVHRLVAEAFLENSENKRTVNHKDGNKQHNFLENLEWATHAENNQHAADTGLSKVHGTDNPNVKLNENKVLEIRRKYDTGEYSHEKLATEYLVTRACILKIVKGRNWKNYLLTKQ